MSGLILTCTAYASYVNVSVRLSHYFLPDSLQCFFCQLWTRHKM